MVHGEKGLVKASSGVLGPEPPATLQQALEGNYLPLENVGEQGQKSR